MSTIDSLMARSIVWASPDETVETAVDRMNDANVGAVLVKPEGEMLSIFTERDVMRRVLGAGLSVEGTLLKDVATRQPVTIVEGASVKECAHLIREKNCRHMPVLNDAGEVVGMISARDFLTELARGFERAIERAYAASDTDEVEDFYDYVVGNFTD